MDEATRKAADKVQALSRSWPPTGGKVQVETSFSMRPIYDQYRNKEGQLLENQRPDKIDAYEVSANVTVRVQDMAVLERVYGAVLTARPSTSSTVYFQLEPSNELNSRLQMEAVKDAARRAREGATAAGARLGAVKVIDPSEPGLAKTDVTGQAGPSYGGGGAGHRELDADELASRPQPPPPPPPPPPPGGGSNLSIQVVLRRQCGALTTPACVYAISG